MLTNEQRAHDLALLMTKFTMEANATKFAHGENVPVEAIEETYVRAYEKVLPALQSYFSTCNP